MKMMYATSFVHPAAVTARLPMPCSRVSAPTNAAFTSRSGTLFACVSPLLALFNTFHALQSATNRRQLHLHGAPLSFTSSTLGPLTLPLDGDADAEPSALAESSGVGFSTSTPLALVSSFSDVGSGAGVGAVDDEDEDDPVPFAIDEVEPRICHAGIPGLRVPSVEEREGNEAEVEREAAGADDAAC